jgi:hypothetical protein
MTSEPVIMPGDRVIVFDTRLYVDDRTTPLTHTMRPATVLRRYGFRSDRFGVYPDCVDVRFDHRPEESRGHFTDYVKLVPATEEDQ